MKKLAAKCGADVSSFEVKELIGEYDFVSKQLYQMKDVKKLVQDLAGLYKDDKKAHAALDEQHGEEPRTSSRRRWKNFISNINQRRPLPPHMAGRGRTNFVFHLHGNV